ncbi:GPO family capsid scaffolding protein [Salmonella enterica]|nr:GPO family capsid scaffolding protein [Salmonella enterica]
MDGRTIEPQWLIDAAETYTRNTISASVSLPAIWGKWTR